MLINKFTAGMMIGGIAGVMGIKMMNSSKRERKKMMKNGRKFIERAGEFIEELR
ncbi:MAG TPA: hypothetical protein PKK61_13855 [Defluviitaleaceae bacterium]|jgi:hypothetical protein|nr:hypothetical protein [Candidatus Epulonipiscium sp.]HOA82124.1 hypothetical protein [Defluviitaleaceae bacterium]